MRKRIEELANGRIDCIGPAVEFSVSRIEIEVPEGKDFKGEFTITSRNQIPVRGLVYSSNPRLECLTEGFDGQEIPIQYKFHSAGLTEGDIQQGELFVVCSQGEYTLSFVAVMTCLYADSGIGVIRDLQDFAKLAKNHWQEAKKVFYSPGFLNILKNCDEKERFWHIGLARGAKTDRSLEEFFLASKLKEPVLIGIKETEYVFSEIREQIWQDVVISKNTWGYVEIYVESDGDFLIPRKNKLTTEDFLGSEAGFGFYINPAFMHEGKNFGRLVFKNMHQEITISVCAAKDGSKADASRQEIRKLYVELMTSYVDYRLKKIVTGRWTLLTGKILDRLTALDEEGSVWYRLFKAQALWTNGQRQEAEWILSEFKRKCRDKKSPQWGYYMYICTLMDHEEVYINRLTEEIESIYLENQDHILLFWCLLFLKKDYDENGYQKLKALEKKIMRGTDSPLLYVEVYWLFCREPYLMNHLGEFELKILNWARKQGVLTKALVDQLISVFPERLHFQKTVFALLEACYDMMDCAKTILYEIPGENALPEDKRVLSVICGYLIRNQRYGPQYFNWYAMGVEGRLRITGLYEAYLMSMDTKSVQKIPQIIQMYFKYNNQLGSVQKAVLYVNIIAAKEKEPKAYEQNYPSMEKFAYEQMEMGRIDDNLAVIYKEVLSKGICSAQISDALSEVLFVHRLTCFWPGAVRVIVLQKQTEMQRVVPLVNHVAYFPLYSNDYCIFIEDAQGNRFSSSVDYQLEKLMHPGRYLKTGMQYSPEKLPYLLYYFADRQAQEFFEEKDLAYFQTVMASDEVDWAYKAWLFPKMFCLMHELERPKDMEYEMERVDFSLMHPKERSGVLEICLKQKLYEAAFRIAGEYGFGHIEAAGRIPFISYYIHKLNFARERKLLFFCTDTFLAGKYNDAMLKYLCMHYDGPTKIMTSIFERAEEFGIDTKEIAERILVRMLYTAKFADCTGAVYDSYADGGNAKIRAAYLTYFSYCSFTGKGFLPEGFFAALRSWQLEDGGMNEACGLAMLKFYAENPSFAKQDETYAEELLQRYVFQGMYFAFYRNFSENLLEKYLLHDKYYIEYRTEKNRRVWIHYTRDREESYRTEEMYEVYEGIFVKKVILFAGESIRYNISEEIDGQMEAVKSGRIQGGVMHNRQGKGRYDRLNEMISLKSEGDMEGLSKKIWEYEQLESMAEKMFTIIK